MRRVGPIIALVLVGATIGVGVAGVIGGEPPPADPDGLVVVCTPEEDRCWQGGEEVRPPRNGAVCIPGTPTRWGSSGAGPVPAMGTLYYCGDAD